MKKHAPILLLRPRPSLLMAWGMVGVHMLAGVAVWMSALAWPLALGLSLALLASLHLASRATHRVRELRWGSDGAWQLELADGRTIRAALDARASRSLPWWVTLAFRRDGGGRMYCWLPRSSLSAESYRRLRVRLRIEAGHTGEEPGGLL